MWDVPVGKALPPSTGVVVLVGGPLAVGLLPGDPVVAGSAAGSVPGDGELSRVEAGQRDAGDLVVGRMDRGTGIEEEWDGQQQGSNQDQPHRPGPFQKPAPRGVARWGTGRSRRVLCHGLLSPSCMVSAVGAARACVTPGASPASPPALLPVSRVPGFTSSRDNGAPTPVGVARGLRS